MSYISAIETTVPEFCHKQDMITMFFQNSTTDNSIKRKMKIVANRSAIDKRYSVIPDYSLSPEQFTFFPKTSSLEPQPTLSERMTVFKDHATELSLTAVRKIRNFESIKHSITHIITVTCTGLFAPGLDVELIKELKLDPSTQRSSINFMGCNAAILALKNADTICNSIPRSKVLIVCTELCTIHFQKNYSDDYLLSTALFGDGCAAVIVDSVPPLAPYIQDLKIKAFNSLLLHEGQKEMSWQITEKGFIMSLTSYVSELIKDSMKNYLQQISLSKKQIDHWAIHPGGKRILDDLALALHLTPEDLKASYSVLKNYGNMSSATILFVLKEIVENRSELKKNSLIFAAAFGPGLSIETMQLQNV